MRRVSWHFLAYFLVVTLLLIALFGASLAVLMPHDMGCPFAAGCVTTAGHLGYWQSVFMVVLTEVLVFLALASLPFTRRALFDPDVGRRAVFRLLNRAPARATLLERLYSDGILNRKESYLFLG